MVCIAETRSGTAKEKQERLVSPKKSRKDWPHGEAGSAGGQHGSNVSRSIDRAEADVSAVHGHRTVHLKHPLNDIHHSIAC